MQRNLEAHCIVTTPLPSPPPSRYAPCCLPPLRRGAAKNVTQMLHTPSPRLRCVLVCRFPSPLRTPSLTPFTPSKNIRRPILDIRHEASLDAGDHSLQAKQKSKQTLCQCYHEMSRNKRTMVLPTRENPTWASATTSYPILCENSHPPFAPVEAVSATKQTDALAGSIKRGGKGGVYERHDAAANREIMRVRVVDCSQPQLSFTPAAQTSCNNGNDNILKAGAALTEPRWSRIARGVRSQLSFLLPF